MLIPPIAAHQGGIFTRDQARSAGFTAYVMRARLKDGSWQEFIPGAFHLRGAQPGFAQKVLAACLLTQGVASHLSAAALHGLGVEPAEPIHVTTPRRRHENLGGVIEHRLLLRDDQTVQHSGIFMTDRLTTLGDLLCWLPERQALTYYFRAIQQNWIDEAQMGQLIDDRRGLHGIQRLREFAKVTLTGAHSFAEKIAHDLLIDAGIPFHANVALWVRGQRIVVDLLLDGTRVVIEVDGRRYHADATTFQRDRERQNLLVAAGYTLLRFTAEDLTMRSRTVVETIAAEYRKAAA